MIYNSLVKRNNIKSTNLYLKKKNLTQQRTKTDFDKNWVKASCV